MTFSRPSRLRVAGLAAFSAFVLACGSSSPEPTPPRPNVVVIFSDELAPEFLGVYGGDFPTPNLDRLAAQGMRFDRAFAGSPLCISSLLLEI